MDLFYQKLQEFYKKKLGMSEVSFGEEESIDKIYADTFCIKKVNVVK